MAVAYCMGVHVHVCVCVCVQLLSCVQLFVIPWTAAHQAPLSMGFSRQEYWSGLPDHSGMTLIKSLMTI